MKRFPIFERISTKELLGVVLLALVLVLTQASSISAAGETPVSAHAEVVEPARPMVPPGGPTQRTAARPTADVACSVPVDVALVFDSSASMDSDANKFSNARTAALSFINTMAGGVSSTSFSPSRMAAIRFRNSTAQVDAALTTNASTVRTAVTNYTSAQATGYTNIGEGLQQGQLQLINTPPTSSAPKYMILLSDGGSNHPSNITDTSVAGTSAPWGNFYIDVNDNGYIDSGDDFLKYWNPPTNTKKFEIIDGLLQVVRGGDSSARQTRVTNLFDVSNNGVLGNDDNYTFPELGNANFQIYQGTLYLAQTRNPSTGVPVFNYSPTVLPPNNPTWTPNNLTYDLAVLRNGDVWQGTTGFIGDGADVYARYWATQAKKAGTFIYVIGYALTDANPALNEAMASPGGYFPASIANIGDIFNQISQRICGVTVNKTRQGPDTVSQNTIVTFNIAVQNTGSTAVTNVTLTDNYPSLLTFYSASPAPTSHNENSRTLVWQNLSPASWPPLQTGSISVSFITSGLGTATNCVSLAATGPNSIQLANGPSCASVAITPPTAVGLDAFDAAPKKKRVTVKWSTGTELDLVGFNVLRSNKRKGEYKPVNAELIPAKAPGQLHGASYKFKDKGLVPGKRYFYKLELVGMGGGSERSDVIVVKMPGEKANKAGAAE